MSLNAQDVRTAAVVGAGTIGPGIALALLLGGLDVCLVDIEQRQLDAAAQRIREAAGLLSETGAIRAEDAARHLARLTLSTDLDRAVADADFVEECVPEDPAVKREVLKAFEAVARPDVWLATNTSTLSFSEFVGALGEPSRVVGVHWVQPPYIVPTVEVVRGEATAAGAVAFAVDFLRRLGKVPVVVRDIPGFIVNRLQHVLINEALSIVAQGAAGYEDVDAAFRDALAPRLALWGIFGTHDRSVNKRTSLANARHIARMTGDAKFGPSPLFERKVAEGALGVATGRGWYDYRDRSVEEVMADRDRSLLLLRALLRERFGLDARSSASGGLDGDRQVRSDPAEP